MTPNLLKIGLLTDSLCKHNELIFFKFRFIDKQFQKISKETGRSQKTNNKKKKCLLDIHRLTYV